MFKSVYFEIVHLYTLCLPGYTVRFEHKVYFKKVYFCENRKASSVFTIFLEFPEKAGCSPTLENFKIFEIVRGKAIFRICEKWPSLARFQSLLNNEKNETLRFLFSLFFIL